MVTEDRYRDDIVAFAEAEYVLPQTGQPIKLLEHQKRILRDVFTRDADGRFPYQTVMYSCPKKSGKTQIGGLVAEWFALSEEPYNEVYCPANDQEQSQGRVFRAAARSIQSNPRLRSVKVGQSTIAFPNGTTINALASDYAGIAGANPGLTIWDELWAYTSERARRLYDELTPVPTRKNSMRFIVTYAGIEGESNLLEELYEQGMAGKRLYDDLPVWVNGDMYMYWDTEPRMPWQTEDYYAKARADLQHRPNAYRRMHLNGFTAGEDTAIEAAEWDALVGVDMAPDPPSDGSRVYLGIDASKGAKKGSDTTAVAAVRREGELFRLVSHRIWKPTGDGDIDLRQTLLPWLLDLRRRYSLDRIMYDPYNLSTLAQMGREAGLRMEELPQTPGNQTAFTGVLLDQIRSGNCGCTRPRTSRSTF